MPSQPETIGKGLPLDGEFDGFSGTLRRVVAVAAWLVLVRQERAHARCALASLDDRLLADTGIDRVDATRESVKPFWRD